MHQLLQRQLRQYHHSETNLSAELETLFDAISIAYEQADTDRRMIENSLEIMSEELRDRNEELRQELSERRLTEQALQKEKEEQQRLIKKLEDTHVQLLQSEKMASIGQLAAGVAHEINNPIGYIQSNINTLHDYVRKLFSVLEQYQKCEDEITAGSTAKNKINEIKDEVEFNYLTEDIIDLINESSEGTRRVRQIVQDLKEFSYADREIEWAHVDIHDGINSTLNVVNNEIKYKAEVVKEFGNIPDVECVISQLNQVFLNLLVNAAYAIKERGVITIRTGRGDDETIWVEVSDTGSGISEENIKRIFDPFFTTKPVGKGTGLGLSLSYGIIQNHHGEMQVSSQEGEGTTFRITLPITQGAELILNADVVNE